VAGPFAEKRFPINKLCGFPRDPFPDHDLSPSSATGNNKLSSPTSILPVPVSAPPSAADLFCLFWKRNTYAGAVCGMYPALMYLSGTTHCKARLAWGDLRASACVYFLLHRDRGVSCYRKPD
jgi:hypothetical protein